MASKRALSSWLASSKSKSRTATTPSSNISISTIAARPIEKGVATFLDLPGEIRNAIYLQLLPDIELNKLRRREPFRNDGRKTSTVLMRVCRQVYKEAASILYAAATTVTLDVLCDDGDFCFFGNSTCDLVKGKQARQLEFKPLKRFTSLRVMVFISEPISEISAVRVCNVQDALFTLADALRGDHSLHSLSVQIKVGESQEVYVERYFPDRGFPTFKVALMQKFKGIKPGALSRPHMTAFLTDSIRTFRSVSTDDGKKGKFALSFIGQSGKPWNEIPRQVRDLVLGNAPVRRYAVLVAYGEALKQLDPIFHIDPYARIHKSHYNSPVTRELLPEAFHTAYTDLADGVCEARIRRDVADFIKKHEQLLEVFALAIDSWSDYTKAASSEQAELWEQGCRELIHIRKGLERAVPAADTDTSFFGYNLIDDSLREWQTTGREEARQARKRRKAERDADGVSSKKSKTVGVD